MEMTSLIESVCTHPKEGFSIRRGLLKMQGDGLGSSAHLEEKMWVVIQVQADGYGD